MRLSGSPLAFYGGKIWQVVIQLNMPKKLNA